MGRLIDADEMLKRLEEWNTNDSIDKAFYNFCVERINEQPTAYDVEKVVAKLKDKASQCRRIAMESNSLHSMHHNIGNAEGCEQAINIVRKGGVE